MKPTLRMSLATAVIAGLAGFGPSITSVDRAAPPSITAPQRKQRRQLDGLGSSGRRTHKRGPGWTHAQVQRMARKARNVQRNRHAHR